MRIAWVSPLPPSASGIADYSFELLPMLARQAEVTVVAPRPGRFRRPSVPSGVRWIEAASWAGPDGFDAVFHHLGNNPFHRFVYELALLHRGVTVFHDRVLHHMLGGVLIERPATRDVVRYERILRSEHGEAGSRLAELRLRGVATDFEKFLFPISGHLARGARAIVVHSPDTAERMREAAPAVPVRVIPHYAPAPPTEVDGLSKPEARKALGLPADAFVVGHFGFVTRPKQPAAVIGGFGELASRVPEAVLLIVGADHSGGGMERLLEKHGVTDRVRMTGFVDLRRFHLYLRAVDAVVALRYPTAGESSGTVARALREGLPVIVNDVGGFADLGRGIVCKVEVDGNQAEQVGSYLIRLAEDERFRRTIGEAAARYAATELDPRRCADLYLSVAASVTQEDEAAAVDAGTPPRSPSARLVGVPPGYAPPPSPAIQTPTISGSSGPRESSSAMSELERRRGEIERLVAGTLPPGGSAVQLDLIYRLLLRRPGEEHALREGALSLAAGTATRAELARWIVESREFEELELIEKTLLNQQQRGGPFAPDGFHGPDTTERVVEIPWVLSRLGAVERGLDVGYAYASGVYLTALLGLHVRRLHGVDRSVGLATGMIRTQADVRDLPYRDGTFDAVLCISTIEHIGLDNTRYGIEGGRSEAGDVRTIREFERVLRAGGRLLISVPFGLREDASWYRQYDRGRWEALVENTSLEESERGIFQLTERGWGPTKEVEVLERLRYGVNAPAAQGVLCAALVKPGERSSP